MRPSLALSLCAGLVFIQPLHAADDSWTPTQEQIRTLEARLKLPSTPSPSGPLTDYNRYYAGITKDGRRMIRGELVAFNANGRGKVHITAESDFPVIMDGGCGIVNFLYDVADAKVVSIGCNGLA